MTRLRKRTTRTAVIAVALALVAIPASMVFASDVFSDVSSSAYYHNSVNAVFNAGITSGCGGSKYCPGSPVTRGQMAVFLDRLGGLSLGPGGIPRPVVDALTDQGTVVTRFFQDVAFSGVGNSACAPATTLAYPADFGDYALVFKIYKTPVGITPAQVNVQLRDADDPAPDDYVICLREIGSGSLPNGMYRLYGTQMTFVGQGLFASARTAQTAHDAATRASSASR